MPTCTHEGCNSWQIIWFILVLYHFLRSLNKKYNLVSKPHLAKAKNRILFDMALANFRVVFWWFFLGARIHISFWMFPSYFIFGSRRSPKWQSAKAMLFAVDIFGPHQTLETLITGETWSSGTEVPCLMHQYQDAEHYLFDLCYKIPHRGLTLIK